MARTHWLLIVAHHQALFEIGYLQNTVRIIAGRDLKYISVVFLQDIQTRQSISSVILQLLTERNESFERQNSFENLFGNSVPVYVKKNQLKGSHKLQEVDTLFKHYSYRTEDLVKDPQHSNLNLFTIKVLSSRNFRETHMHLTNGHHVI